MADRRDRAGFDHRQPVLDSGRVGVHRRDRRGALVHHQLPHRRRPAVGPTATAGRSPTTQGTVGAAQPDSFGAERCAVAASPDGPGRGASEHRPRSQGRERGRGLRAERRPGRRGAPAAGDSAGRLGAARRCADRGALGGRRGAGPLAAVVAEVFAVECVRPAVAGRSGRCGVRERIRWAAAAFAAGRVSACRCPAVGDGEHRRGCRRGDSAGFGVARGAEVAAHLWKPGAAASGGRSASAARPVAPS